MADLWSMTVAAWEWMGGVVDDIWPPDNPHAADDLGDAWDRAATLLEAAITKSSTVHDRLRETWPDPNGAFVQARIREANDGEYGGGGSGHRDLVVSMRKMATFCHNYADQIERVRNQIWSEIIHASVEFALMAAIPGGPWMFAARMAKRIAEMVKIAKTIAEAANKLGKFGKLVTVVAREAGDEVITNGFEQGLNIWQGNQDGFSWKESATNALGGAIGAPVSGIVGAPLKGAGALARKVPGAKNVLDSGLGKHATTAVSSASTNAVSSPISSYAAQSIMDGNGVPTDLAGYGQSIKDNWLTSAAIGPIRGNTHLAGEQVMEARLRASESRMDPGKTDMETSFQGPPPNDPPGEVKAPESAAAGAAQGGSAASVEQRDPGAAAGQGESGTGRPGGTTADQGGAQGVDGGGRDGSSTMSTVDSPAAGARSHAGVGSTPGQATVGAGASQTGQSSVPQATTVGAPAATAVSAPGVTPSATVTSATQAPVQTTSVAPATPSTGSAQAGTSTATTSAPAAAPQAGSQPGAAQPASAQSQATSAQSASAQQQGSTPVSPNQGAAAKSAKAEPEADRAETAPEPDDDGPNPPESETREQEEVAESTVDDSAGEPGGRPGNESGQVLAAAAPAAAVQQEQRPRRPAPARPAAPGQVPAHTTTRRAAESRRTQGEPPAEPPRRPPGPPPGTGESPDVPDGVPSRLAAVWDLLPSTARQAITELLSSVDPDALADQAHEFAARLSPGRMDRSLGEILAEMSASARRDLGGRLAAEATVHRSWGAFPAAREAMSELLGRVHPAEAAATLARLASLLARPPELAEAWDALSPPAREAVAGLAAKMNPDKLVKRLTDLAGRVSPGPKGRSLGERVSAMSADQLAAFAEQVTAVADRIPARKAGEEAATPADLARANRGKGLLLEAAEIQAKLEELAALGVDVRVAEEGLREELGKARRVLDGNTQVPKTALDSNYENVRAKYAAADVALALAELDESLLVRIGLSGLRITGLEVPVDESGRAGTEARNNDGTDIDIRGELGDGTEVRFEVKDRTALFETDLEQTARQRELAGPGPKVVLVATNRVDPGFAEKAVEKGADRVIQYDGFQVFIEVAAKGTEGEPTPPTPPAPPPDRTPPGTGQGPPAPEPPSAAAQRFYHPENPEREKHPTPSADVTDAELASSRHSERALRALIGKSRLAWNDLRLLLLEHGLLPADSRPLRLRDVERVLDGARVRSRIAPALRAAFDNAIQEFERLARGETPTMNSESSRNRAWRIRKEIRDGTMTPGRRERFLREIFADDVLARQQEILGEHFGRYRFSAGVPFGLDGRGENGDGRSHYAGSAVPDLTLELHPAVDPRTPGSPVVVQGYHLGAGTEPSASDVHREDTFTRALFEPEILTPTSALPPIETRPGRTGRDRWSALGRITFTGLHLRKGLALIDALIEADRASRPQRQALRHALERYARAAARLDERLPDVKWLVQRGIELTGTGQDQLIDAVASAYGMSSAMVAALVTDPSLRSRVPRDLMPSIQELDDFSEVLSKARTHHEELLRQTEDTARELEFAEREWLRARDATLDEMTRIGDEAVANGLPEWARRRAAAGFVAELGSVATRARVGPEDDPAVPEPARPRGWSVRDLAGIRATLAAATRAVEESRYAAEVAYHAAMAELRSAREDVRALTGWVPHLLAAGDRTDVAEALGLPVGNAAAHRLLPGAESGPPLEGTTADVRAEVAARQDRLERATERMRLADAARTEAHAEYVRALVPAIERAAGRGLSTVEIARIAKLLDSEVAGITRRAENPPSNRKPVVDRYVDARGWLIGVGDRVTGREALAPSRGARFAALDPDSPDYAAKARELGVDEELANRLGKPRPVHFFHDVHMHPKGYDAGRLDYRDLVKWLIAQGLPNILVASPIPQSGLGVIGGSSGSFYYALTNVVRMTTVFGKKMLGLHGQLSDLRFFSARDRMTEEQKSHWFPGVSGARVDVPGVGGYLMAMAILFGDAARYLAETTFVKEMVQSMLGRQASEVINPEWIDYFGKLIAAAELVRESIHQGRIAPEFFATYLADGSPMAELFPVDGGPSALTEMDFYDSLLANAGRIKALLKAAGLRAELRSMPDAPPEMYNANTVELLETIAATGQVLILHDDMGLARLRGNGMYVASPSDGRNLGPMAYLLQQERLAGVRVIWAHLGIGHWTTLTVDHIERLQWLLDTTNTAMDISWNVLAQHAKAAPEVREALIRFLIVNQDRLIFGTDTVNPQPGAHYVRHRNEMDPLFAEAARRPGGAEAVAKILHGNFARLHDEAGRRVTAFVFNEILSGAWDGFVESFGPHWQRKVDEWVEARIAEGWVADPAYQPRGPLSGLDLTDGQRAKDQPWLANPQLRTMKLWYTAADPGRDANANPLRLQAAAARISATETAAGVRSAFGTLKRRWAERGGLRPVSGTDALLGHPVTTQALLAGERIRAALAAGEISRARLAMTPGRLATLPLAPAERDAMLASLIESVERTERKQLAAREEIAGLRSAWLGRDLRGWAVAGAAAATVFGVGATMGVPFALSAGVSVVAGNAAFVVRGMLNIAKTGHAQSNRVSLEGMLERGRLDQRSAEALARTIRDYLEYDVSPLGLFDDILEEVRGEVEVRTRRFLINLQAIIHTPLAIGERPSQRQEDVSLEVSRYLNEVGRPYGAAPESITKMNPHAGRLGKVMASGLAATFLVNLPVHVAQATSLTGLAAAVAGTYAVADGLFLFTALSNAIGGIAGYDNALRPLYRRIQNALAFPVLTVANGMLVALEASQGEWLKALAATTLTGATFYISKLGTELELRLGRQAARKGPAALWVTASSLVGLGMMGLSSAPLVAAAGTALAVSGPVIYVVRAAWNRAYDAYQARTPSGLVYTSNIPVLGVGAAVDLSLPQAPKLIEPSQPDNDPDDPGTPDEDPGGAPSPGPTPPTPPRPAGPSNLPDPGTDPPGPSGGTAIPRTMPPGDGPAGLPASDSLPSQENPDPVGVHADARHALGRAVPDAGMRAVERSADGRRHEVDTIAAAREQFARLHKDPAAPKGIDDVINPGPSAPGDPGRNGVPPGGRRWQVYRDLAALTRGTIPPGAEPAWHRHTRGIVTAATNIVTGPPSPPSGLTRWVSLIETAYGMAHNARQLSAGATYDPELVRWAQEHPDALKYFRMPELSPLARTSEVNALPAIHAGVVTPAEQAWQIENHHSLLPWVNPNFTRPDAYAEGWQTNGPQAVVGYFHGMLGEEMRVEPVRPEDASRVDGEAYVAERLHGVWEAHDSYDSVIDEIHGAWWSAASPSPLPPTAALHLTWSRSGPIVEKWGLVRWTEGGVVFLSPVPGTLMLLPENPLSISLLPITYGEAAEIRPVGPPTVPEASVRPADPGQVAWALGELDAGLLAGLGLPGLVVEGVDADRPAVLHGTLADGTVVRIAVVDGGSPGFDALSGRIIRDRAVAPPGTKLVYLFAATPAAHLAEGMVGVGADVVLRQAGSTGFEVVAARNPAPAPDLFSRRAARSNQDIVDSGEGLPRTQETVARAAEAAGIDLGGVRVQLVESPEVIEYLDEVGACASTPPESAGETIWLGPASFADVETLVAVLAHEMTHVRQLRAGSTPTERTRESLEQEAEAAEGPALERFRNHDEHAVRGGEDLRPAGQGRDPGDRPVAARHAGGRFEPPAPDDGRRGPGPRPGVHRPEPAGDRPPDDPDRPAGRGAGDPGIDPDGPSPDFLNLPPTTFHPLPSRSDAVIEPEPEPAEPEADRIPIEEVPGPLHRDEPLPSSELRTSFRGEDDPNDPNRAFAPEVVEYFSPERREEHRVFVRDGKLYWARDGSPLDTSSVTGPFGKSIFAMDPDGNLYVSLTWVSGRLHHSSFLAGAPVAVAGHIEAVNGRLTKLTRESGHYQPEKEQLATGLDILAGQGVDVSGVDTGLCF
ncbi:hypothetical protein AB0N89_19545 [Amycolatopsis sp. NPDC089917]|uniref:WXG100-like domain-containing protein n=1 Tax=Amycolatopsis sp. NPDC089917 TaxID=3155187 RepID=UPI0034213650